MYRGHRSDGSMMWMSLSRTLKLPCAMSASPSARLTTVWWGPYARCALVVKGRGLRRAGQAFLWVLIQILLLDILFSLDSVITAVGMANRLSIMVTAMV